MSEQGGFDLEPTSEAPAAPRRSAVRNPRSGRVRHAARAGGPPAAPAGRARWLGWLVSPRVYYLLSLVLTVGLTLALFNPDWGVTARWPHEVLGLGGEAFQWDWASTELIALLLLALAYVVALCRKPARGRGLLVLGAIGLCAVTFQVRGSMLLVLVGSAAVGGALLASGEEGGRRRRRTVLLLGLLLLAGWLFLPWPREAFHLGISAAPDYQATAFDTIDAHAAPSAAVLEEHGWIWLVCSRLGGSVPLLLAAVGALAWLGLGGRWARWAAGLLLLLGVLGTAWHLGSDAAGGPWHDGVRAWAQAWFGTAALFAHLLGLGAGLADLSREG